MKLHRQTLLLLAALVWSIAGANILEIGLASYGDYMTIVNFILSAIVFCLFHKFVFARLVKKHTARIMSYEKEIRHFFLKFFDLKAFIIMVFMMTGGILLRKSDFTPEVFIAVFYTGLGTSLLLAGLSFGARYLSTLKNK